MRVVVLGRNGAGSRSHYITGYHGYRSLQQRHVSALYVGHHQVVSAQGVTYIILTDCLYSCTSLSNYTYVLYITLYYTPSIRNSPNGE